MCTLHWHGKCCIRHKMHKIKKCMLEAINYNKVDPVI